MIGTTAALIAGGLMAAGSTAQGVMASKAAGAQASAERDAMNSANAAQMAMYNQTRQDQKPFMNNGVAASNYLAQLLGLNTGAAVAQRYTQDAETARAKLGGMTPDAALTWARQQGNPNISSSREMTQDWAAKGIPFETINGIAVRSGDAPSATGDPTQAANYGSLMHDFNTTDFQKDPGYDFRMAEGSKALERSAAARGTVLGGAQLKALDRYNQDFASNEYLNAYNRYNNDRMAKFNMLSGVAGAGEQATNVVSQAGQSTGAGVANTTYAGITGMGNARASGYTAIGGAIDNGMNDALNAFLRYKAGNSTAGGGLPPNGTPPIFSTETVKNAALRAGWN